MKAMGKVTLTLGLMIIVSLFLTSCSGVVTPELQLDLDEDINTVTPETASGNLENTVIEDTGESGTVYPQKWATGDGTVENPWANDCIQKAYDFVPDGGTIFLKAGYYTLATTLTITKKISIIGEGRNKSIIVLDIADDNGIEIASTADYCTLKGFTVDGDSQTDGVMWLSPILVDNCDYVLLEEIEVKNAGYYGINIHQVNHSLFQNIYAHDNYRHGLHPGSETTGRNKYNTYRDIYAWNNGHQGFDDRGDDGNPNEQCYNIYDGLNCWDNGGRGIYIAYQRCGILSNSVTSGNALHGICLQEIEDFNIHDCFTTLEEMFGLSICNAENVNFTNVIVKNNNVSDGGNDTGIRIEDSSNIRFTSCQSYDDRGTKLQAYGIKTVGSVGCIELVNCKLTPNAIGAIDNDAGAVITITEAKLARFYQL